MPPSHFFSRQNLDVDRPRYVDRHMREGGDEATELLFRGHRDLEGGS